MYNENLEFDDIKLEGEVNIIYQSEVETEEGEVEEVDKEIDVSTEQLELVCSTSQGERGMGEEIQHTYEGEVEDEDGNIIHVEIELYEYPLGVVSHLNGNAHII